MPPQRSAQRGRPARGRFVRASELPAAGIPPPPPARARARRAAESRRHTRHLLFAWDSEEPVIEDAELMELRGLPNGHQFDDFELAEYINERLADYEHAREEMAAEHPDFQDYQDEEQMRTLYEFYPDIDWLQVRD
jgi:hypothetical protein